MSKQLYKDTRIIYLVIFGIIFGASLVSVTLPMPVVQWTRDAHTVVDKGWYVDVNPDNPRDFKGVTAGTRVFVMCSGETNKLWGDMSESVAVVWTDLMNRGAHILLWSSDPANAAVFDKYHISVFYGVDPQNHPDYGVKFVDMGYLAGGNALLEQWRDSIIAISPTDRYGNNLADLPMMQNFDALKSECELMIGLDQRGLESMFVIRYNTPVILMGGTDTAGYLAMHYTAGYYKGMIMGQRGGAEYEALSGIPGKATTYLLNSMLIAGLVTVCLIVGNVQYLMQRKS
ncbi:hypothetical protein ISS96_02370 [Candidatus Bathyarchaeota archaeon]|nr:hypothetical protein [Candidatus Bathyarchaeota archaeon]